MTKKMVKVSNLPDGWVLLEYPYDTDGVPDHCALVVDTDGRLRLVSVTPPYTAVNGAVFFSDYPTYGLHSRDPIFLDAVSRHLRKGQGLPSDSGNPLVIKHYANWLKTVKRLNKMFPLRG